MLYKITPDKDNSGQITVPEAMMKGTIVSKRKNIFISAGSITLEATITRNSKIDKNEIILSEDIIQTLMIPLDLEYQIIISKDTLKIGPIIGLLMSNNKSSIGKNSLAKMMNYTLIYPEIGGLLVVFSADSIDLEKKYVEGYFYNPSSKGRGIPWYKGKFPLPYSIFSRTMVSDDLTSKLKDETNNCFFNSRFFNKWEFWKIISKNKTYNEYLPETKLYSNLEDIDYFISKYKAAYLKPLNGTLSRGLYKVTKTKDGYGVQGKQGEVVEQMSSSVEAEQYIRGIVKGHKYIVQQAINPLRVKGRHMDFRVIMQKDQTLDWQCTGIVALIGSRGDICTNWGSTSSFEDIFYNVFNFSQQQIFKKKREVVEACKGICKILDSAGENYGDLGFDVVIDEKYNIWILEANKRHYHSVPLWINDVQTFYQTKSNPIKYAAAQAGFRVY